MKNLSDLIGKTIQSVGNGDLNGSPTIVLVFSDDSCVHITGDDYHGPGISVPTVLTERLVKMVELK